MPIIKPNPHQDQVPCPVPDGALALVFEMDSIIFWQNNKFLFCSAQWTLKEKKCFNKPGLGLPGSWNVGLLRRGAGLGMFNK